MNSYSLTVTKRTVFGKQLKKLRKEGILPGNIYGKDIESAAVQLPLKEFEKIYDEAGSSSVVEITFEGKKRPTLIHNLQYDYVNHLPLHADFFQVNLKEKVKTTVPVELIGEPKAVTDKLGLLLQTLSTVDIEALPTDLPEKVEIDVTHLAAVGDQVKVSAIKKLPGVDMLTEEEQVVANIGELVAPEKEEPVVEEASAEGETTEGTEETSGEGEAAEKPQEEQKAE